jgi:hypothetical protein
MQPLSGVLVLDFTTLLPGPLATLLLAEAGAEVIKIERPGGEDMRRYEPRFDGESMMFTLLNRGKTSIVADLKLEAEREKLKPLLARAAVLVEQFRPGVMARLGLGSETVRAINPRLIYCSVTGYGQSGRRAGEAGHDLNYIGATGLLALNPGPIDRPVVPPALIADIGGGTLPAVINILLGLRQRDRTGLGSRIDIAMTDAMFTFAGHALAMGHATGFPSMGGVASGARALSALSDATASCLLCSPERSSGLHLWRSAARLSTTVAIRPRARLRSPPSLPAGPPTNGGRCSPPPTAASPSWRARRRRAIHFVARDCSPTRSRGHRVQPCRRCRCRSIQRFATRPAR